jgi:hypothetical protein
MRILVVGSRRWTDCETVNDALRQAWIDAGKPRDFTIIVGTEPGVDVFVSDLANKMDFNLETHDVNWHNGQKARSIRNKKMIASSPDICLAFIYHESPGPIDFANKVKKAKIPVKFYYS